MYTYDVVHNISSKGKLGKVTFYFSQVFDADPLFTKMECGK